MAYNQQGAESIAGLESLAIRGRWDAWFEAYGVIQDGSGTWLGRGHNSPLVANYLQTRISDVVQWCQDRDMPVRLLLLKPRQRGCSTFSSAGLYQEACKGPMRGAIIGAKLDQAKNLFKMIGRYSSSDEFDWGCGRTSGAESAVFKHGSGQGESEIGILSAREYDPGRSGTYQFVLCTEVARWQEEGVANAGDVLSGLLKCVSDTAGTVVIQETTAQGASGDFYDRWTSGAMEFEDYQRAHEAGEHVSGKYIRVFAPWFRFPELSHELTPEQQVRVRETLGKVERYNSPDFGSERDIMDRFGLGLGQISWRRQAIDTECKRDPRVFEQDYPSTWQSAFLTSGNRRFNGAGLRFMEKQAALVRAEHGLLEPQEGNRSGRVSWVPTDESEGMVIRWEEPRDGNRYLICADVATGRDQTQGKEPDCHSVFVLRAGYWEANRGWVRPATAARIKGPCRWEVDLLGEWIRRLHWYYRGALIVPEINNPGLALLQVLKPWGLPIYRREVYDEFEKKFTKQMGFKTTPATKPLVIAVLARAIREYDTEGDGLDVYCPRALGELKGFIRKPDGKEEAMDGSHDDDVMSLAIGYSLIEQAVRYVYRWEHRDMPADLREVEEDRGVCGMQYS